MQELSVWVENLLLTLFLKVSVEFLLHGEHNQSIKTILCHGDSQQSFDPLQSRKAPLIFSCCVVGVVRKTLRRRTASVEDVCRLLIQRHDTTVTLELTVLINEWHFCFWAFALFSTKYSFTVVSSGNFALCCGNNSPCKSVTLMRCLGNKNYSLAYFRNVLHTCKR